MNNETRYLVNDEKLGSVQHILTMDQAIDMYRVNHWDEYFTDDDARDARTMTDAEIASDFLDHNVVIFEENGRNDLNALLSMAGITTAEVAIASHEKGYESLDVAINEDGDIYLAYWGANSGPGTSYPTDSDMAVMYRVGTGDINCNCDACSAGESPEGWAGDESEWVLDAIGDAWADMKRDIINGGE